MTVTAQAGLGAPVRPSQYRADVYMGSTLIYHRRMPDILIRNLTSAEALSVAAALGDRTHEIIERNWTESEAIAILTELSDSAARLIRLTVEWDGVLTADALRDHAGDTLRGASGPITKTQQRLARDGVIRADLPRILVSVYDPNNRSYQRLRAYRMDTTTQAAFAAAITKIDSKPHKQATR